MSQRWTLGPNHPDYGVVTATGPAPYAPPTPGPAEPVYPTVAATDAIATPTTESSAGRVSTTSCASAASAGPGTLAYAIERWHAAHPDFRREGDAEERIVLVEQHPERRNWTHVASRLGIPLGEYERHRLDGDRWCSAHRGWHPADAFYASPAVTNCKAAHQEYVRARRTRRSA